MAQSTLHFAFGMAVGSAWAMPRIIMCWKKSRPMAAAVSRWLLLAYGLGLYASIPSLLRRVFDGASWATASWTHIFLLYPMFDRFDLPSIALGEACIAGIFGLQYAVILLAIRRANRSLHVDAS
jgi:hypothetical protein